MTKNYTEQDFEMKLTSDVRETVETMITAQIEELISGVGFHPTFGSKGKQSAYGAYFLKTMLEQENFQTFTNTLHKFPIKDDLKLFFFNAYDMVHKIHNNAVKFLLLKHANVSTEEHLEVLKEYNISIVKKGISQLQTQYEQLRQEENLPELSQELDIVASEVTALPENKVWQELNSGHYNLLNQMYLNDVQLILSAQAQNNNEIMSNTTEPMDIIDQNINHSTMQGSNSSINIINSLLQINNHINFTVDNNSLLGSDSNNNSLLGSDSNNNSLLGSDSNNNSLLGLDDSIYDYSYSNNL
jgi:hypothetical protein